MNIRSQVRKGPDRKDMVSGAAAAALLYLALGLGMIFLLPLVIALVITVWALRRFWKAAIAIALYRILKRRIR